MWGKVLYIADSFCLHGNIRPWQYTTSFFGALKLFFDFFVFLVKISRLYTVLISQNGTDFSSVAGLR